MSRKVQLGSASEGTLRTSDLLDSFRSVLRYLDPEDAARIQESECSCEDGESCDECAGELEELTNALEELAPDYCYFGTSEGDGACFGFWPSWEVIEEDRHSGELPSGESRPDAPEGESTLFLEVNDHGNATLYAFYEGTGWREVWSVV